MHFKIFEFNPAHIRIRNSYTNVHVVLIQPNTCLVPAICEKRRTAEPNQDSFSQKSKRLMYYNGLAQRIIAIIITKGHNVSNENLICN